MKAEKIKNKMRNIRVKEIILNCGAVGEKLERSMKLLELISGMKPIKTKSRKRIPGFGIRPGLEIGCKVTLRGRKAIELLKKLFESNRELKEKQFGEGYVNFSIEEYITIPGFEFKRDIGILGFNVSVNLYRAGLNVEKRRIKSDRIPKRHKISKEETIKFMKDNFDILILGKKSKEEE